MKVDAASVKKLREQTGAGVLDCKKALDKTNGVFETAAELLREKGFAKAAKKDSRGTPEGKIGSYIHTTGKIGAMVEVKCETDFVANNDVFTDFVKNCCMQVAATDPVSVGREAIAKDLVEKQKEIFEEEFKDKPSDVRDKIVEGKLENFYKEKCLLEQPFVKNGDQTINDLLKGAIAKLGENIRISRFVRFHV
ncbi:MAG: elongation factor Ts [Candidatus Scalindua sp. AMX11]|nr:MAG: elongation factor Ts [Candidatus Scalindua sp.]NOG85284.1 elongation factor Ts [Planctomycetota bacterium]RZV81497.1 MAG: elongation factor Ts [Candidatus Scalindua sp. SCAELEC01]TDE65430.1 MAG: elongation factor Ts [Candidatus Scalindua sp. AMX11]GJQ59352.1 MAG: elongation factor Ts [Candidatus Scalindua sp.]